MDFGTTTEYLLSLGNEVSAMKLGLESMRKLLDELGAPHQQYLKAQVAGTNGKGSVCAFLNSICLSAGIKVGMYTSPHLVSITERVQINGVDISEVDFARLGTLVRERSEKLVAERKLESVPTFFEQVTAIALLAFAENEIEVAILETGLGGRLDATTATNAEVAAITRIDLDHQQYLGETITEIAAEKAAIIRRGSRVVVGEQQPDAMQVIGERCRGLGIEPVFATGGNPTGRKGAFNAETVSPGDGTSGSGTSVADTSALGLAGRHQIENASVAVALAEILSQHFPISNEDIVTGLRSAQHPGRLERIGPFLLDGAHNASGARALREYLDEFVNEPITLVFGAMNDKEIGSITSVLFPMVDSIVLTTPDNSRAMTTYRLLQFVPTGTEPHAIPNVQDALEKARELSGEEGIVVVTGSLYLVGEVRRILTQVAPEKLKTEK